MALTKMSTVAILCILLGAVECFVMFETNQIRIDQSDPLMKVTMCTLNIFLLCFHSPNSLMQGIERIAEFGLLLSIGLCIAELSARRSNCSAATFCISVVIAFITINRSKNIKLYETSQIRCILT